MSNARTQAKYDKIHGDRRAAEEALRNLTPGASGATLDAMRIEFEKGAAGERMEFPDQPPVTPDAIANRRRVLIPARFHERARFDAYTPATASQKAALELTQRFVKAVRAGSAPMLALIGRQGTGKSHLLYAALWDLLGDDRRAFSRPWYQLADQLRYGGPLVVPAPTSTHFGRPVVPQEAHEVRAQMWSHNLTLIDEVRPTASTMFDDTELAKFACHAYDNAVAVMLTTNVSPLAQVMGEAAASRFTQVVIDGPDHRQTK